jgi:hypothetical protein
MIGFVFFRALSILFQLVGPFLSIATVIAFRRHDHLALASSLVAIAAWIIVGINR